MKYRSDIDGLRAIAVMSVIAFHSGVGLFSGGYVGVDIFFVISGYLITTLIYKEMNQEHFTFSSFYRRRAARLLPALAITILMVISFGFIFYNTYAFDNLGKEIFFSSIGAANILFASGINYFVNDESYQPLIHLWSLGVEEQFYIIWPVILLVALKISKKIIISVASILLVLSLGLSIHSVNASLTKGYFLLQYRAFELLFGAIVALVLYKRDISFLSERVKSLLSYLGLILISLPILFLDKNSSFPGINAVWPCLGACLIIAFPNSGLVTRILSVRILIFLGLISYPLYLYHQPIVSFIHFFGLKLSSLEMISLVLIISVPASWLTYKYIEKPIRKAVHIKENNKSLITLFGLISIIPFFASVGLFIAKSGGFEERFRYLNPFALEISKAHSTSFHKIYSEGFIVDSMDKKRVLFVGDSVLQHYVVPMIQALGLKSEQVDIVSRGGCVLLKGVDFKDTFASISCSGLREDLYEINKKYDYVVISQAWDSYDSSVLNFSGNINEYSKWSKLLDGTIEHFSKISNKVIIIGAHPLVDGTNYLQPSVSISKESFTTKLSDLRIINREKIEASRSFFEGYSKLGNIIIIEPYRIFCNATCKLTDGHWSYFSDAQHLSDASTEFVSKRIVEILQQE